MVDYKTTLARWWQSDGAEAPLLLTGEANTLNNANRWMTTMARCQNWNAGEACSECTGCLSAGLGDVLTIDVEGPTIGIEELRAVQERLRFAALAERRLVLMPQVERLTVPAANALLKTLEDSATTSRFLLTTATPLKLLPTVRSRCHQVRLGLNSDKTLTESEIMQDSRVTRLLKAEEYSDDAIEQLDAALRDRLRREGPSQALRIATTRLRDYYRVRATRGNQKLAKEVLLASLP